MAFTAAVIMNDQLFHIETLYATTYQPFLNNRAFFHNFTRYIDLNWKPIYPTRCSYY
jgi:hypothetical protein